MKKIKVTEKSGASIEYINDGEVLNRLHLMGHGLPEREELDENGEPTGNIIPAEYTVEITDITQQVEQEKINAESLKYLQDTDWYIIRELDSGVPCPVEIKTARANARAAIIK
jgi:hypothetical protein